MNKSLIVFPLAILAISCNETEQGETQDGNITATIEISPDYDYFGDTISIEGATSIADFESVISKTGDIDTKIEGTVVEVCQAKGCWMDLQLTNGKTMKVKFKDYGFFVPLDIAGRTVIIEGNGYQDTTGIEELRHYAEDAGKSQEEIESINEPEIGVRFLASGVAVKKE